MKKISWNPDKNRELIRERNLSFELIVEYISNQKIVEIVKHPNQKKYPEQNIFILNIQEYIHMVPYVENEEEIFLKTIIPSRKLTKAYLGEKNEKKK